MVKWVPGGRTGEEGLREEAIGHPPSTPQGRRVQPDPLDQEEETGRVSEVSQWKATSASGNHRRETSPLPGRGRRAASRSAGEPSGVGFVSVIGRSGTGSKCAPTRRANWGQDVSSMTDDDEQVGGVATGRCWANVARNGCLDVDNRNVSL